MKRRDLRTHPLRRQVNEAFCDERGEFSIGKFIVVWAQISVLAHMNVWWREFMDKPEALAIVLCFIAAPHILVKLLAGKFGAATK